VADLLAWIEGTSLATWTRESPSIWAYPTILTLHTVGLGIVVGMSTVIDLRLLGYGRRIPLDAISGLFRMIAWAFALNAVTGVLLFMSDATTKGRQPILYIKLSLIGLALWNTVIARRIVRAEAGELSRNRLVAVMSLVLWSAAITAGRLMAYV
jgi:hypothetical protein